MSVFKTVRFALLAAWWTFVSLAAPSANAQEAPNTPLKVGIIGLDTSHAPAFAKLFNAATAQGNLKKLQVVAAYPGGSDDIAASRDRVGGFTAEFQSLGIEILDSTQALVEAVDKVMLLSVDGRKHWPQLAPVFESGKDVYIDKPLAGSLVEAIAIDLKAKASDTRWFSSSSLRFSPTIFKYRNKMDSVKGATAWSPCSLNATHPDLFWYGIHGVETLYTAMGPGCETVVRAHTPGADVVVGTWADERIGVFRGLRESKTGYGLVVFGQTKIELDGKYEGYAPLVDRIAEFFLGGEVPVANAETLEIMTFMQAADESLRQGGKPVQLKDVWNEAYAKAVALSTE